MNAELTFVRNVHEMRIIVAALVPAKGDEHAPWIATTIAALETQGMIVIETVIQRRGVSRAKKPGGSGKIGAPMNAATYIGRGKAIELAEHVRQVNANAVVFCNSLSGTQKRNLERIVGVPIIVYDRSISRIQ